MTPSLSTCSLPGYDLPGFLAAAAGAGYERFEAFTTWTGARLGPDAVTPDELARACAKSGVKLATLNIAGITAVRRADIPSNLNLVCREIDYARRLGLNAVSLKGGGRDQPMEVLAEAAVLAARHAAGSDIRIRLGNHPGNRLMTSEDYREFFGLVGDDDRIEILADTRHLEHCGQSAAAFLREWNGRVGLIHINDHVDGQSVPLGAGEVDIEAVLSAAAEIGYGGFLTVEIEVEDTHNAERYARDALRYLNEVIARVAGRS